MKWPFVRKLDVYLPLIMRKLRINSKKFEIKTNHSLLEVDVLTNKRWNEEALFSLKETGVIVIRNALEGSFAEKLAEMAENYLRLVLDKSSLQNHLQRLNYAEEFYASDLVALDPMTKDCQSQASLEDTLLFRGLNRSVLSFLHSIFLHRASWSKARVRIVFPEKTNSGALNFHQEKQVVQRHELYTIWAPLNQKKLITNRDMPGIQFLVGDREFLHNSNNEALVDRKIQKIFKKLNQIKKSYITKTKHGYLYRPELSLGDIIIFDGDVPHASFMPENIRQHRVSCDIRLFPTTSGMSCNEIDFN